MKSCHPEFSPEMLQKDKIYDVVFPQQPKVASKLEKLYSKLYTVIKSYILWKRFQQREYDFHRSLDWAKFLNSVGHVDKFERAMEKTEREFLLGIPMSEKILLHRFQFESLRQEWMSLMNKGKEDINLNQVVQSLGVFFEAHRIEYLNQIMLQKNLAQFGLSEDTVSILHSQLNLDIYYDNLLIRIPKIINEIFQSPIPPEPLVHQLYSELSVNESNIELEKLKNYYAYLRNFCSILINNGHNHLNGMLFDLLKRNLMQGYLYKDGGLHTTILLNITRAAIVAGEVEWAMSCIEQHKHQMIGDIDTNEYYNINIALCLFEKKEFEQVLTLLAPASLNIQYLLISRRLEIMCYYETNSELLPYKLEAFKVFIWRASEKYLSSGLKEGNKAFVNTLLQMLSMGIADKGKKMRIAEKLLEKPRVSEMMWLLEKLHN